jgi:predicted transcriptional regulator
MASRSDILISVLPQYIEGFLSGQKTVELRRRPVKVPPQSRVWIYSKKPRGMVELLALVDSVHVHSPRTIWDKFGHQTGLDRRQFNGYFQGVEKACAIVFSEIVPLDPVLPLQSIRVKVGSFLPPQFFRILRASSPELRLFRSAVRLASAHCFQVPARHAEPIPHRGAV